MNASRILSVATKPLVAGILAILPLALTVAIVLWLAGIVARLAGPQSGFGALLKQFGWNLGDSESGAYFGGVLFALLVIYVFGLIILTVLKGRWEGLLDTVLMRLPVVSTVYDAAKRVTHALEPKDNPDIQSMSPVMCNFGGEGGTSFPAFLTTSESVWFGDNECSMVMIPTAPVPLGGAIMCVPKSWITPLDCGIDGLLNVYLPWEPRVRTSYERSQGQRGRKKTRRNVSLGARKLQCRRAATQNWRLQRAYCRKIADNAGWQPHLFQQRCRG